MMQIPISAIPSQTVTTVLGDQNCTINIYQKSTGLFIDVLVDGEPIVYCRICRDRCKLIRYDYLGFIGDLTFIDAQGTEDPEYSQLGNRFVLCYIEPSDLAAA